MVHDRSDTRNYVFLLPDEGFTDIVKLHDRLYTGVLAPELRMDPPFIPHLTIGHSLNAERCKNLVDRLIGQPIEIAGAVETLVLLERCDDTMETRGTYRLV